jgi:GT2 family glycosyltransferase
MISILMTCHNRRDKTLHCIRLLMMQHPCGSDIGFIVVDDGSTDGTSEAIAKEFPAVKILKGDGSLYWCGGMRKAWREAVKMDPDYYLLMNDDTHLYPEALQKLVAMIPRPDCLAIAIACICDPVTRSATFGGIRRKVGLVPASGQIEYCDTFNANCALIPRAVYVRQGILYEGYTHGLGDFDYGCQARKLGIDLIQSAEYLGECSVDSHQGTWRDRSLSRKRRFQLLESPKGLPFREWLVFNYRNSGWKWPLYAVSPLIRVLMGR